MELGASSLCLLNKPFERALSHIQTRPDVVWELVDDGTHFLDDERIRMVNRLRREHGIRFTLHAPYAALNISATNPVTRIQSQRIVLQSLDHARRIETPYVVLHPGGADPISGFRQDRTEIWQTTVSFLQEASDRCRSYGIVPLVENMAPKKFILTNADELKRFFTQVPMCRLAFDIPHAVIAKQLEDILRKLKRRMVYVHVSDNYGTKDRHWPLDKGSIEWRDVIDRLTAENFNGPVIVENTEWRDAVTSLSVLSEHLRL